MAEAYFRLIACVMVCAVMACSPSVIRWQDGSGKSRGQDLARIDLQSCQEKLGFPGTAAPRTLACMEERGWKRMKD